MTFDPLKFWRNPDESEIEGDPSPYFPPHYIDQPMITTELLAEIQKQVQCHESILEPGCNVGRNLAALKYSGYTDLAGIEINPEAIELGRKTFNLEGITIYNASIEDLIETISNFDCIFTQSVLMHLPPSSAWVFEQIANRARKVLITRENEGYTGKFQWARNYFEIFSKFGWKQVHCKDINHHMKMRTFRREHNE